MAKVKNKKLVHNCNEGWVCAIHPDHAAGHMLNLSPCEKGSLPCEEMDCPDSKYDGLDCVHVWIIPRATGPTSKGVCNICDEERVFDNSIKAPGALV